MTVSLLSMPESPGPVPVSAPCGWRGMALRASKVLGMGIMLALMAAPARPPSSQTVVPTVGRPLRVLHLGDSHVAAQALGHTLRTALQERHGDGGPGLLLPGVFPAPGKYQVSRGWRKVRLGGLTDTDPWAGLGGAYLEAGRDGESIEVQAPFRRVRLSFLARPGGGEVSLALDGLRAETLRLEAASPQLKVWERTLAPGSHKLLLRSRGAAPVRLLGLALEGDDGLAYSALGTPGAKAGWLMRIAPELFLAQLKAEAPDVVVLAYGTNEANSPDLMPRDHEQDLVTLLRHIKEALPLAQLVLCGPPDGRLPLGRPGGLGDVVASIQAAAKVEGATFIDLRADMGGPGSVDTWVAQGLAHVDHIHFTQGGYQAHAQCVAAALDSHLPPPQPGARPLARRQAAPRPPAAPTSRPILLFRAPDGVIHVVDDPSRVPPGSVPIKMETP